MSEEHGTERTHDHDAIRRWAESHGGRPSSVRGTSADGPGVLRIDFEGAGAGEEALEPISWKRFFEKFEDEELDLLYRPGRDDSRFCKFVARD